VEYAITQYASLAYNGDGRPCLPLAIVIFPLPDNE